MRICKRCGQPKWLTEENFAPDRKVKSRLSWICRLCKGEIRGRGKKMIGSKNMKATEDSAGTTDPSELAHDELIDSITVRNGFDGKIKPMIHPIEKAGFAPDGIPKRSPTVPNEEIDLINDFDFEVLERLFYNYPELIDSTFKIAQENIRSAEEQVVFFIREGIRRRGKENA